MRPARLVVLLLWACALSLVALDLVAAVGNVIAAHRSVDLPFWASTVGSLLGGPAFATVGAVILFRYPRHPIGWIMALIGLSWGLSVTATDYERYALITHPGSFPAGELAASLSIWMVSVNILLFFWLVMLFPDGHVQSPWQPLFWSGSAVLGFGVVGAMLTRGPSNIAAIPNPIGLVPPLPVLSAVFDVASLVVLLLAAAAVVHRFHVSRGVERQQIKWFAYGAAIAMILLLVALVVGWHGIVILVTAGALTLLPATIGVAILHYRLYDIDVLINRTLVYGSLTASLGGLYVGGVLGLQTLARLITGQTSDLAVAIVTLAVAALFNPWRRSLQKFIDRRFYRRKYDATRVLADFNTSLRHELDLDHLTTSVMGVLQETMEPSHVSIWVSGEAR